MVFPGNAFGKYGFSRMVMVYIIHGKGTLRQARQRDKRCRGQHDTLLTITRSTAPDCMLSFPDMFKVTFGYHGRFILINYKKV